VQRGDAGGSPRPKNARGHACHIMTVCGWGGGGVRAQRHEAATPVGLVSLEMCAPQGAPCKRAGRRAARNVRSGSMKPLRRGARRARGVLPSRGFACSHQHTGCGQALGLRHTGWRSLRRAVCEERGRELDAMEPCVRCGRDLRCSTSPSGPCEVGHGHGCGQRTRERRWRRGCRQLGLPSVTSALVTPLLPCPEATPRLSLLPLALSTPCGSGPILSYRPCAQGAWRR
jgi:hypothetical protein